MDSVYSLSLLMALVTGAIAALIFVSLLISANWHPGRKAATSGAISLVVSVVLAMVSGVTHLVFGHGPDSAEPMRIATFVWHHKAYLLVFSLLLVSVLAWGLAGRHREP